MNETLRGRNILKELDLTADEFLSLVALAAELKSAKADGRERRQLNGRNIALIFEKTSTRTRCAFEVAAHDQGAHVTYLGPGDSQLGRKESVEDTARVLGTAGFVVALTGLTGGAALVAVTTRIAQQARALPKWAVWVSYAVAVLCLSGFWSGGMASVAFALWLIGAVIGVLRAARVPQPPAVPTHGAPAPEAARTPPTATSG